jgi:hypothetical protein
MEDTPILLADATREELIEALTLKMPTFVLAGFQVTGPDEDQDAMPYLHFETPDLIFAAKLVNSTMTQLHGMLQGQALMQKIREEETGEDDDE